MKPKPVKKNLVSPVLARIDTVEKKEWLLQMPLSTTALPFLPLPFDSRLSGSRPHTTHSHVDWNVRLLKSAWRHWLPACSGTFNKRIHSTECFSGCHEQQHVSWSHYCSQVNSVKSLGRRTVVCVESESVVEEAEMNLNKFSQFLDLGPNSSWDWHWLCIRPQKCGNAFLMDPCSPQAGLCFIISSHATTQFCSIVSLVLSRSSTKTNDHNTFECCFLYIT